jgi:hypothetical protein
MRRPSFLLRAQKPRNVYTQYLRESLELIIENTSMVVLDFRDRRSIELNSIASELSREIVLRDAWTTISTRFGHTLTDDVLSDTTIRHGARIR